MGDNRRTATHMGMIIEECDKDRNRASHFVMPLDVPMEIDSRIYAVPIHHRALIKDKFVNDLVAETTKLTRSKKPLLLGDMISWEEPNGMNREGMITSFVPETACYPTSCKSGIFELILGGARKPEAALLWCDLIGYVPLTADVVNLIMPDIWLQCRIQITLNRNNLEIKKSFAGVESISEEEQHCVLMAPWNAGRPSPVVPYFHSDSGSDDEFFESGLPDIKSAMNIRCIATSERRLMCLDEKWSKEEFVVPVLDPAKKLQIGKTYKLNAFPAEITSSFLVSSYSLIDTEPSARITPAGNLWATVKCHEIHKSVWHSSKFGYLDDPLGLLSLYYFTRYAQSNLTVGIEDAPRSRNGQFRFRIVEFCKDKKDKVENWITENEIEVSCNLGIFVDSDKLFTKEFPEIIFHRRPNTFTDGFEVGLRVKFTASYDKKARKMYVTTWTPLPHYDSRIKAVKKYLREAGCAQWVFNIMASVPRDFPEMLESDDFGLIDDRNVIRTIKRPNRYDVWVTLAYEPKTAKYRLARTIFQVIKEGPTEPLDEVPEAAPPAVYRAPTLVAQSRFAMPSSEEGPRESIERERDTLPVAAASSSRFSLPINDESKNKFSDSHYRGGKPVVEASVHDKYVEHVEEARRRIEMLDEEVMTMKMEDENAVCNLLLDYRVPVQDKVNVYRHLSNYHQANCSSIDCNESCLYFKVINSLINRCVTVNVETALNCKEIYHHILKYLTYKC